ncbi:ABC transporter substrate-binding protein [Skermanella stibiiresistens]|nr:ABC transporter substrate-binding protein [Skermanella stibiiresistens]
MLRNFFASLCVAAAVSTAAPALAQTKLNFRLDWTIYGSHAPFYLALESGLYEKAGLDVSISEGQGSATVTKLVAQGGDQAGFIDFGSMVRGVEQGMPLIGVMRVISGVMCVISHEDVAIRTPQELDGKVVAYAPSESTGQIMPALLAANGVDPAKVSVLTPATGAKNAVFLQRRADAIPANTNVQIAQLEAQGAKVSYFKYSDFGVDIMNNGIVFNADYAKANPEVVRGFVAATQTAFEMARKDPKSALDALVKRLPQQERNRTILARQLELTFDALETKATHGKPLGHMEASDWESMQALLVKYTGLPRAVPVETLYTNEYLPK